MNLTARFRSWWKALAHRSQMEAEVEAELQFHIERYAEDLTHSGMPREDALRRARMELGTIAVQKEHFRTSRGLRPWDDLSADLRYALRQLRHTPAFTATVLVVLALGIGANAAMFSVIDATLLRWLPYRHPIQLVSLSVTEENGKPSLIFFPDVEEWQRQSRTLAALAYYTEDSVSADALGGGRVISSPRVSANLFRVLGVQPFMGRGFLPEEQTPGQDQVVVLSNLVWSSLFAADPAILGKQITLNDAPYTVVGVMPRGFVFPANDTSPQIWLPSTITEKQQQRSFSAGFYQVIARMDDDSSLAMVRTELSGIQTRLAPLYDKLLSGHGPARVEPTRYRDTLVKDARPALLALILAVAIIWLIACANVANLMLARAVARQREIAVRVALGASRWRVIRQLFTESLLLSAAGSAAGLALAQLVLSVFRKTFTARLNVTDNLAPDLRVLAALLALSFLSAILFGLMPAWLATRTPLEPSLRQGSSQAGHSRRHHHLQQAMVVAEIGLSLVLLVACGLLLRTVFALRRVPLGFRSDHVLLIAPKVPTSKYRGVDLNTTLYRPLLERVKHLHGVRSAGLTTVVPLRNVFKSQLSIYLSRSQNPGKPQERIDARLMAVGPELQDVLGFRMYQGRFFNQEDTPESQPVAVVNRAFANLYSASGVSIDKFSLSLGKGRNTKIVGVMDDFHQASIDKPSVPEIDFCASQLRPTDGFYQPTLQAHVELAIRTSETPLNLIPDLRRVMAELSPDLQTSNIEAMDQVVEDSMGSQILAAHLLELFAGSALLVALAGLYGLLAYLVAQRTRELGVRLALGAQRRNIIDMLLAQAGRLLLAGAVIGISLALFSARMLSGFLYGVKPHDMPTLAAVTALLLACGLAAAFVPARRASRVDPMEALRGE